MAKWWNWILILALVCLVFIAIPLAYPSTKTLEELRPIFEKYVEKFNKTYKNNLTEYETRLAHFVASVEEIDTLNSESRGPDEQKARYGLTEHSDMSKEEFVAVHLSDEIPHHHRGHLEKIGNKGGGYGAWIKPIFNYYDKYDKDDDENVYGKGPGYNKYVINRKKRALLPMKVDWREKGVIGPVRDQGLCGACWAFSTIGTLEAMAAISSGTLNTLSVQEAIDCAGLGNVGCAGGDICLLLDWLLITNTAVEQDKEYPLRLTNGVCQKKTNATGVRVQKFTCDDLVGSEDKIIEKIATHGPVTVAVNGLTWQNYLGGVIQYHCSGSPKELNHAVQLVGYDLTAEVPYYIAKNSWGKSFGVGGYLQLAIGSNICGLANEVASVDIKP